jgi:hypothetical protein
MTLLVLLAAGFTGFAAREAGGQPKGGVPAMAVPAPPGEVVPAVGAAVADRKAEFITENPVFVPLGPNAYGMVFEQVFDIISEYFEIAYANRYDGRIETFPRIAAGLEQPWRPGSPDFYQRLLATFQTIRHRAFVQIQLADDGGYFIQVIVFRELEDLPRPTHRTAGAAAFRSDNSVERQFEVIDPGVFHPQWIPVGRDHYLEDAIVQKIRQCL